MSHSAAMALLSTNRLHVFFNMQTMGLNQPFVAWDFALQFSERDF